MQKGQLLGIVVSALIFSGCCHCIDDPPFLKVEFQNYSAAELSTVNIIYPSLQDTCAYCLDTISGQAYFSVSENIPVQIKSDSLGMLHTVNINRIRGDSYRYFLCECYRLEGIDYNLDGDNYTNEPIIITK